MGRPTKLTPELQKSICNAIRGGNTGEASAEAYNVDRATFYRWMSQGEAEDSGTYRDFHDAVTRARARAELRAVKALRLGMLTDPKMAVEWLKRARHRSWEPKQEVEVRHGALDQMTEPELLAKAAELHAKVGLVLKGKGDE